VSERPAAQRRPAPPSGMPPPAVVRLPSGAELDLPPLAREVCRRYDEEFPDERERYGPAGMQWCVHDNQHLLNWAVLDLRTDVVLADEVAWLAKVLEARDFPLDRLARNLELDAEVVRDALGGAVGEALAERLVAAAGMVRERGSFL
jgi:hypothetical protein